jgi:penicillin amidase
MNLARDAAAAGAAAARVHAPVLSIVYADTSGEIGYSAAGSVPVRDAATAAWTSQSSASSLAAASNPAAGFIVTANNAIGGSAPPLSTSFDLSYRAERIAGRIAAESALSLDDVAAIQRDVVSRQPGDLAALLFDQVRPKDLRAHEALRMLKAWDGTYGEGSAEAVLFKRYYHEATRLLFADELGETLFADYQSAGAALARAMHRFAKAGLGAWCDDVDMPGEQACGAVLGEALSRAVIALTREQGSNMDAWRWDRANIVRFAHAPMDAVALLRPFFSRELARPGDSFTINPVMRIRESSLISSYRQVIDVGGWDQSRFVIPLGQSGQPMSAHYDDLLPVWHEGRHVPMLHSEGAVRASAWWSLTLRPRAPASSADTPRGR